MFIIGEKFNSSAEAFRLAVDTQDRAALTIVAREQALAGANALDINTALCRDELSAMAFVMGIVLEETHCALSLDSSDPAVLIAAAKGAGERHVIFNSVHTGTPLEAIASAARARNADIIVLPMGDTVPQTAQGRLDVAKEIANNLFHLGIMPQQFLFDALVSPAMDNPDGAKVTLETVALLKKEFPQSRVLCGLSNISYGLPARETLNATMLAMAASYGADAFICDPALREVADAIAASKAILGQDDLCLNYIKRSRR